MSAVRVLAVNVGSSSLRLDVWDIPGTAPRVRLQADGVTDHAAAFDDLLAGAREAEGVECAGHRVVHGGTKYRAPVWIDDRVLADLDELVRVVPLHMRPALHVIRRVAHRRPNLPQAAVFDTAFHATLPARANEYPLPGPLRAQGFRRYGFHGLACADAAAQLGTELRDRAVLLHLGAGCSATALLGGRSVDTTMGLTPLEGLMMATRCGDLDPAIPTLLQRQGRSADEVDHALNHESGLLGLSGVSADMRTLLARAGEPAVRAALDVFCYRAAKAVGAMAVALGGCEQVIFTGGIGEHAAPIRAAVVGHLAWLGAELDEDGNAANATVVSRPGSRVAVQVVRIDEGRQIAQETACLRIAR